MNPLNNLVNRSDHRQMVKRRANVDVKVRSPPTGRLGNPPGESSSEEVLSTVDPVLPAGPTPKESSVDATPTPRRPEPSSRPHGPTAARPTSAIESSTSDSSSVVSSTIDSDSSSASSSSVSSSSSVVTTASPTTRASVSYNVAQSNTLDFAGSSSSALPSSSAVASGALGTGSIVGIIAAGIIGAVAAVSLGMWLVKRYMQRRDDDEFNRASFMRQSVLIPDEPYFNQPRPPTMIERHYGAAGVGAYASQPSFNPGEYAPPVPQAHGSPFLAPHEQVQDTHKGLFSPDAYASQDGHGQSHYNDLRRESVTPFQAEQYAEISRQLNSGSLPSSPAPAARAMTPTGPMMHTRSLTPPQNLTAPQDGRPASIESVHASAFPMPASFSAGNSGGLSSPAPVAVAPKAEKRPHTVYNEEDAYGGI